MINSVMVSRSSKNLLKEPSGNHNRDMFMQLTRDLKKIQHIGFFKNLINNYFCPRRCKNERMTKFNKFIRKSQSFIKKEMDL